jgi:hypothetical protein
VPRVSTNALSDVDTLELMKHESITTIHDSEVSNHAKKEYGRFLMRVASTPAFYPIV